MRFNGRKRKDRLLPVDMTPMIDIVFQLLIFFLTTAQLAMFSRAELDLPVEMGEQEEAAEEAGLIINILSDGSITIAGESLDDEAFALAVAGLLAGREVHLALGLEDGGEHVAGGAEALALLLGHGVEADAVEDGIERELGRDVGEAARRGAQVLADELLRGQESRPTAHPEHAAHVRQADAVQLVVLYGGARRTFPSALPEGAPHLRTPKARRLAQADDSLLRPDQGVIRNPRKATTRRTSRS